MRLEDFISRQGWNEIIESVRSETNFEYKKTVAKIEIGIHSSSWRMSGKEGRYMVCIGSMGRTSGSGWGEDPDEFLKHYPTYSDAIELMGRLIKHAGGSIGEEPQMRMEI